MTPVVLVTKVAFTLHPGAICTQVTVAQLAAIQDMAQKKGSQWGGHCPTPQAHKTIICYRVQTKQFYELSPGRLVASFVRRFPPSKEQ